ncbi:MAG: hypothetical protein WCX22_11110 [Methanoregula sp.]
MKTRKKVNRFTIARFIASPCGDTMKPPTKKSRVTIQTVGMA